MVVTVLVLLIAAVAGAIPDAVPGVAARAHATGNVVLEPHPPTPDAEWSLGDHLEDQNIQNTAIDSDETQETNQPSIEQEGASSQPRAQESGEVPQTAQSDNHAEDGASVVAAEEAAEDLSQSQSAPDDPTADIQQAPEELQAEKTLRDEVPPTPQDEPARDRKRTDDESPVIDPELAAYQLRQQRLDGMRAKVDVHKASVRRLLAVAEHQRSTSRRLLASATEHEGKFIQLSGDTNNVYFVRGMFKYLAGSCTGGYHCTGEDACSGSNPGKITVSQAVFDRLGTSPDTYDCSHKSGAEVNPRAQA